MAKIYEGPAKEDKLDWNTKAAELDNFIILRHPPSSLLGRGKADVRFTYKNNEKSPRQTFLQNTFTQAQKYLLEYGKLPL